MLKINVSILRNSISTEIAQSQNYLLNNLTDSNGNLITHNLTDTEENLLTTESGDFLIPEQPLIYLFLKESINLTPKLTYLTSIENLEFLNTQFLNTEFLLTENGDIITTENDQGIII